MEGSQPAAGNQLSHQKSGAGDGTPGAANVDGMHPKVDVAVEAERNYEDLGARLERMKGVVQKMQQEVVDLTNKMGGFMNLPPADSSKNRTGEVSQGPHDPPQALGSSSKSVEVQEISDDNKSPMAPKVGDTASPLAGESGQGHNICSILDPQWKTNGMIGSRLLLHSPSPSPQLLMQSEDESPHKSGTPVRTPVGSPMCRSPPRSTDSPDVPSRDGFSRVYSPEPSGSESDESEDHPWGHPPAKFLELVRQLQLGYLPESVLLEYDTAPPKNPAPIPPRTEWFHPKPWEGKIKKEIESYFASSIEPTIRMRKDSPIPQSGSYSRSRFASRATSRSRSVSGTQVRKSATFQDAPGTSSAKNSSKARTFIFGRDAS